MDLQEYGFDRVNGIGEGRVIASPVPKGDGWGTAAWGSSAWGGGSGGISTTWTTVSKRTTTWTDV